MNYNKSLFQKAPKINPNKSRFNLSHEYKAELIPGKLFPVLTLECMPGDYFSDINTEFMFRMNPLYYPIMHKFTMRADYFYIPNRILWMDGMDIGVGENAPCWKNWIAQLPGAAELDPPMLESNQGFSTGAFNGQVLAFMGLPLVDTSVANTSGLIININAFPLSAYLKIWDEYYRNPQLEDTKWFNLSDNETSNSDQFEAQFADWNPPATVRLYYVAPSKWEMDYFTSAIPTPQIGDAITIPTFGIDEDGNPLSPTWRKVDDNSVTSGTLTTGGADGETIVGTDTVFISEHNAPIIKQLRLAEVLQSYYERIMKVGQRYRDFIEGLFGHDPQPGTVDVPVLIGSKFGRIQIADVMTTAYTTASAAQGNYRHTGDYTGQANLYENDNQSMNYFSQEHGWLMCILQVNPNTSYGQGIARFWRRSVQTDYPLDMFAGIGDQEILKEEVLYNSKTNPVQHAKNFETFGYIPRFSEMRYMNNLHIGTLNYNFGKSMTAGRIWPGTSQEDAEYDALEINMDFVTTTNPDWPNVKEGGIRNADIFRVLPSNASTTDPVEAIIHAHLFHTVIVHRQLPVFSTPKL